MNTRSPRRPELKRYAALVLPVALSAVVAFLGVLSLVQKLETSQPLGFVGIPSGGGIRVETEALPSTGLAQGDLLLVVNGRPASTSAETRQLLLDRPTSDVEVWRDGQMVSVRYHRPAIDLDLRYLLLAVSGILYLFIGLVTVAKSRQGHGLLFFLWCLASAAVFLLSPSGHGSALAGRGILVVEDFARIFLPPLMLHLFLVYPTASWARGVRRLIPFLYLPAAVLTTVQLNLDLRVGQSLGAAAALELQSRLDNASFYLLGIYLLAALAALVVRAKRSTDLEERRQLRWMVLGVGAGYSPFFLLYVLPRAVELELPELTSLLAILPLVIVPLTFAYAILRYKLWDIEVIARDAATWTLTLLLGGSGFALLNLLLGRGLPENLVETRTALTFLGGLAIASVMLPARRTIGSSLARLHYGSGYAKRRQLAELGRELLHERNLDQLCTDLLDHVGSSLELDRVNLFLRQGGALVPIRPQPELGSSVPVDLLDDATWQEDVVAVSGLEPQADGPKPMLQLFRAGYRYLFPLVVRQGRVGVLAASYRWDQVPLSSEDVELARAALNQAALAIENAKLVDQLQQQLDEVFRLQQYSEGIIESSPVGLAVLEADGTVRSANLAFAAIVSSERQCLVGSRLEELLCVELPKASDGLVEVSFIDSLRRQRHLQMSLAELGSGAELRRILIAQDVTDRVTMQHELKEKERLASLGMLAAGVAHEVNTPITGISSYAQMLLEETPEDDPRHLMLKKMERQTFRAARIVSSLLEFARQRSSEQRAVSLAAVVSEALDEQRERMRERQIELTFSPPVGLAADSCLVQGNETELIQVFVNLTTNAMDAMRTGGRLNVAIEPGEERVRVRFEDTGVGIPAEAIEKVFQPFFSTKLAQGGTGLGLSISYEIVRRHGGNLKVTSTPGEGSRFVVELPRWIPPVEAVS